MEHSAINFNLSEMALLVDVVVCRTSCPLVQMI